MFKASIIVPVYNEERCIAEVLDDLKKLGEGFEILVIDDGSTDNTARLIPESGIRLVRHSERRGNGAAVKTGIENSSSDILIVFDGDGQYRSSEIPRLLNYMDGMDLIVGSRIKESEQTILRRFGNIFLSRFASFLTMKNIPDLTSGLRAFRKGRIMKIFDILPDRYSLPSTSTILFLSLGYKVKFIPVKMYKRSDGSSSKLPLFKNGIKFLIIIMKLVLFFNPRRVFSYLSLFILSAGVLESISTLFIEHTLSGRLDVFLTASMIVFFFGFLAEHRSKIHQGLVKRKIKPYLE